MAALLLPGGQTVSAATDKPKPSASVADPTGCAGCHREAVEGFARSKMAHSMRLPETEPAGSVALPGTAITMTHDDKGAWQTLTVGKESTRYHVDYVIGSGSHASGYLVDLDNHLFQSPVSFYRNRNAYGLAPGYEAIAEPDFTRPIAEGCVFCHAGSYNVVTGTQNAYAKVPFSHLTITCDRCHGPVAAHLAKPDLNNIVSPSHLEPAARDSVCEQCHLIGVSRVLNPGKHFSDFHAGQRLEDTFTTYREQAPPGAKVEFKVISHSEQLALSKCARSSAGKLWCGTCHDPHDEPVEPVAFYRDRCLSCHAQTTFAADHPAKTSNCIGCHMPQRETNDGGHTAFTDHRIERRPAPGVPADGGAIAAWRVPSDQNLADRNQAIASIEVGASERSSKLLTDGYRTLSRLQPAFPQDAELYNSIGYALILGRRYSEAAKAFEIAVRLDPGSSGNETRLGQAYAGSGADEPALQHLERALEIDPLNLSAAMSALQLYGRTGQKDKAAALSQRVDAAMHPLATP